MNLFVTHYDPSEAVRDLDDKRLKHMPKETIEILTVAIHSVTGRYVVSFPFWDEPDKRRELNKFYIYNHPICRWASRDKANSSWTLKYLCALLDEYYHRFGNTSMYEPIYASMREALGTVVDRQPKSFYNNSMFKEVSDVREAYKKTLIQKWEFTDKVKPPKFTRVGMPKWYIEYKAETYLTNQQNIQSYLY